MSENRSVYVHVTQLMSVSAEQAFDAWLDPALIGQWMFGPALRDEEVVRISVDGRVGGRFSFVVNRQGMELDHIGEYFRIERPTALGFTWSIAGEGSDSRVFVEILPLESGCEVALTHELAPEWADYVPQTEAAWAQMLGALAALLG